MTVTVPVGELCGTDAPPAADKEGFVRVSRHFKFKSVYVGTQDVRSRERTTVVTNVAAKRLYATLLKILQVGAEQVTVTLDRDHGNLAFNCVSLDDKKYRFVVPSLYNDYPVIKKIDAGQW